MQPRRRRGGWGGQLGGLRGGNEEASAWQNVEMKVRDDSEETSSSSDTEMSSDDDSLDYGSQGSELSALLDEELHQVEGEVLAMPDQGWMEVVDEMLEEDGDVSMDTYADQVEDEKAQCGEGSGDDEVKSGAKFLLQLDKDYLCSPRQLVRVRYISNGRH